MQSKRCSRCNKVKSFEEFGKHVAHRDGCTSECKACRISDYQKDRKRHLNYKKKSRAKEENRQKDLAYKKKYNKLNSKKRVEYNKDYCQKNPEWAKEKARLYYWRHREERLIKVKKYKKSNRALYNEPNKIREHRKKDLPATLTEKEWHELLILYDYSCYYCGRKNTVENPLEKEHKIPLSKSGGHTKENIVPAWRNCNARKHTLTEDEFIIRQIEAKA